MIGCFLVVHCSLSFSLFPSLFFFYLAVAPSCFFLFSFIHLPPSPSSSFCLVVVILCCPFCNYYGILLIPLPSCFFLLFYSSLPLFSPSFLLSPKSHVLLFFFFSLSVASFFPRFFFLLYSLLLFYYLLPLVV